MFLVNWFLLGVVRCIGGVVMFFVKLWIFLQAAALMGGLGYLLLLGTKAAFRAFFSA